MTAASVSVIAGPFRPFQRAMPKSFVHRQLVMISREVCLCCPSSSPSFPSPVRCQSSSVPNWFSSPSLDELKLKNAAQIKQLSAAIINLCAGSSKRNKELLARTCPLVSHLESAICSPKGRSRLVLIGSIASGIAIDASSDIDLAFVYCGTGQREQERFLRDFWTTSFNFLRSFLEGIAGTLKDYCDAHLSNDFRMSETPSIIAHTYVPLILAKFDNGTSLDITFPRIDFQSLRNTLMVRHYVHADRRFLLLFHWLRVMFYQMGLKNSKSGLFSSYHILLLVMHFLSRREVPDNVLPVFGDLPPSVRQGQLFAPDVSTLVKLIEQTKVPSPLWKSKCTKSVGELAVELVDYYARFDPWTTAISIEHGRTTGIFQPVRHNVANIGRPKLKVTDPFTQRSSTRSPFLGEALVVGFQFLHAQLFAGRHLATFPELDGLEADFLDHVRSMGIPWAVFLDKNYTPTEAEGEQQQEDDEGEGEEEGQMIAGEEEEEEKEGQVRMMTKREK